MRFQGFGPDTIAYLTGLSAHNEKAWFDAHRTDYDAHYVARAALLRQSYLAAVHEAPHPTELGSKAFVPWCAKHYKAMLPVHHFMDAVLRG